MQKRISNNKYKGKIGEDLACEYLLSKGYKILERNWHYSKYAEIDIIAKDNDTYVFVEVKFRSNCNTGHPLEAIDSSKMEQLEKVTTAYVSEKLTNDSLFRIDVISIIGIKEPIVEHLINIGY